MGCITSSFKYSPTFVVLFVGLDGSGSTTILYQFAKGQAIRTIPTLGFNHETFDFRGFNLECWDLGGYQPFRPLWLQYAPEASGVVFVVDSAADNRLPNASAELHNLFGPHGANKSAKRNVPLLIYANKQDLPNALAVEYVEKVMHIDALHLDRVKICGVNALKKETLDEGMTWLTTQMSRDEVSQ